LYLSEKLSLLKKSIYYCCFIIFIGGISACGDQPSGNKKGAIVLGDSSTIVTEKDARYLQDLVLDIEPAMPAPEQEAAPQKPEVPAPATVSVPQKTEPPATGFTIDFGNVKAVITGITTREFQKQNPEKDAGVSYARSTGNLAQSTLVLYGLKDVKVKQRYQTSLYVESDLGKLVLDNLGSYISDWVEISGKTSGKTVELDLKALQHPKFKSFSNAALKNALSRAAKKQNLKRAILNKWLAAVKRTRDAGDPPCKVELQNVQWQISGVDAKGKRIFKTVRIDN
jgi:hypothetical protein